MSKVCWHHTKRLIVCPFQYRDSNQFFLLLTHSQVNFSLGASRFLSSPHLVKQFLEQISRKRDSVQSWLLYSIFDRNNHQLIGGCGFKINSKYINGEIFYLLFPEYWGRGLAVEACRPLLDEALHKFGLQKVYALILPENIRAQRVAEKLGFKYLKMIHLDRYGQRRIVGQWILDVCVDLSVFNQS